MSLLTAYLFLEQAVFFGEKEHQGRYYKHSFSGMENREASSAPWIAIEHCGQERKTLPVDPLLMFSYLLIGMWGNQF